MGAEIHWGGFRDVGSLLQSLPWLRESGVLPCSMGLKSSFLQFWEKTLRSNPRLGVPRVFFRSQALLCAMMSHRRPG